MNEELGDNHNDEIHEDRQDTILRQVLASLEGCRSDLYDITEDLRQLADGARTRLEESFNETSGPYRDALKHQLQKLVSITHKSEAWLQSSSLAVRALAMNAAKVSAALEEDQIKNPRELWNLEIQLKKIARELHDGPAQIMAGILLRLDLVEYLLKQDSEQTATELTKIREMSREGLDDIRRIMFDLKPGALKNRGLYTTLKEYFNDYESKYNFTIYFELLGQERQYELVQEIHLFRLVQEAIANVRKHSGVAEALVRMEETRAGLTLTVIDNGCGFDVKEGIDFNNNCYGILGMRERAELLGGRIMIISESGGGTQVIFKLPAGGEQNDG